MKLTNEPLLALDRVRLKRHAQRINKRRRDGQAVDRLEKGWNDELERARERFKQRSAWRPRVKFPDELPITQHRGEIVDLLKTSQVVIVCGDTGSGKTTQLPKLVLEAGCGKTGRIGCTQPRRLAAVSMARRVADELQVRYGQEVGCQVRFDDNTVDKTTLKFMTDGILLAETQHDRQLWQYDTLIIDEAHERSLNIDFLLGYIKRLLERRPDLKVVISSATLDVERFSKFFSDAPIVSVAGRTYPVTDIFMEPEGDDEDLSTHILRAAKAIDELDDNGDMLVFLPGEREIRDAADLLTGQRWKSKTEVLPLYGRLSMSEQQRVFKVGGRRRIVLATNVAETSITIPGIHYVIDSGLARISRYDPRSQVQALQIEQISQASARQRRGRCGRIAEGLCVHLYSEEVFEESAAFTDPEILRSSLAGIILQMSRLGLPPIDEFPFIDPPRIALVREGYRTLWDLGALDEEQRLTPLGRELSMFPVDPHIARMICQAREEAVVPEMLVLTAFLSIRDPRERPNEKKQAADQAHRQWAEPGSDFVSALNLWDALGELKSNSQLRKFCKSNFLNFVRIREWRNLANDLLDTIRQMGWKLTGSRALELSEQRSNDHIHRALLAGLPTNVGERGEMKLYHAARNREFWIFPGSSLAKKKSQPLWIMAFALVETGRLYARTVAEIDPIWLEDVAPHLCKTSYSAASWDAVKGFVYAKATILSGGLVLASGRKVHYGSVRPEEARELFIREGLVPGNLRSRGGWLKIHRRMLRDIVNLEERLRRPCSLLDVHAIEEHFDQCLPAHICSVEGLERWLRNSRARIAMRKEDAMYPRSKEMRESDYPAALEFEGDSYKLEYHFAPGEPEDGITLRCPAAQLPLLPDWACDWLIPGWLPEKIQFLIKSLPKRLRVACMPVNQTIDAFMAELQAGTISENQPLLRALADFLRQRLGEHMGPADFSEESLPQFLRMKVALLDEKGRCIDTSVGLPERSAANLAAHAPEQNEWSSSGMTEWQGDELPSSVSGHAGAASYPALFDEGSSVGVRLFTDELEAEIAHRDGLARLIRLGLPEHIRFLEKRLPLPFDLQMSLCASGGQSLVDFLNQALCAAAAVGGRLPRDPKELNFDQVRSDTYENAEQLATQLTAIFQKRDALLKVLEPLRGKPAFDPSIADIDQQLDFLFRPEFLKTPDWASRYPVYQRGLALRADRLRSNPGKDAQKQSTIQLLIDRCAGLEGVTHLRAMLLLEDLRVQAFAQEQRPYTKGARKQLESLL